MKEQLEKVLQEYSEHPYHIVQADSTLAVYEDIGGVADQETYYELEQEGREFRLNRVSRGQKETQLVSQDEKVAGLALAASILKYGSGAKISRPDLSEHLEGYTDDMADEDLLGEAVAPRHYSLLKEKREAVVLDKGEDLYDVVYIDRAGKKEYISEDFETFGDALVVVYNYAWYLQFLERLNASWEPSLDRDSDEYERIAKLLLTL